MLPTCYESTLQLPLTYYCQLLLVRRPPYKSTYKKQTNDMHDVCMTQDFFAKDIFNTHPHHERLKLGYPTRETCVQNASL